MPSPSSRIVGWFVSASVATIGSLIAGEARADDQGTPEWLLADLIVAQARQADLVLGEARAAQPPAADASAPAVPSPPLKLAPTLIAPPPPPRGGLATPPGAASAAQIPGTPLMLAPLRDGGAPIFLRADSVEGIASQYVEARGRVELRTRSETVLADWLRYDLTTDEVWGKGNVLVRRGIDWITGPETKYKRDTEIGFFTSPRYFIGESGGHGEASEIRFLGPDRYELFNARYTTCVAPNEDWYIRADDIEVDKSRMVGTGHGVRISFFDTPVAYTPWLEFPLSNERKSGFLTPTLGSSGTRGFEAAMPYYFNLAPNYDATVTPRLMTKRGLQVGGQFRYLWHTFNGEIDAEILPNDRVTDTTRWGFTSRHGQNLLPGLVGFWNINKVSDDTYFTDLSDRVALTSQTTLPREGGFTYNRGPLTLLAQLQSFQTLQDPTAPPVTPPYNRLPQILATVRDTDWLGLTFAGTGEYVYFREPTLPAGLPPLVTGQRAYAWPTVAWMRQGAAWNLVARTGVHMRHYDLSERPGLPSTLDYAIPITSVDGGLVFERDWSVFGRDFLQTLEPRAFYVYTPYHKQSDAPVFDAALDDFNFAQLFSVNRYLGHDRIADANQLTVAVISRLLEDETGAERMRAAVGQRFYFSDQRVTLAGETPRSANSSDILALGEAKITDAWAVAALLQQNLDAGRTERFTGGFRYTPEPGKVFNASYRFSRVAADTAVFQATELKQFDISWQWPVTANWTLLGRWNYSLLDNKTLEAVAGIEYNRDCWVLRLVGQRLTTTTQTTSNSVYLQIEFTGLGRVGTSPLDLLRRTVPGYVPTNDPALFRRDRSDYFSEF